MSASLKKEVEEVEEVEEEGLGRGLSQQKREKAFALSLPLSHCSVLSHLAP